MQRLRERMSHGLFGLRVRVSDGVLRVRKRVPDGVQGRLHGHMLSLLHRYVPGHLPKDMLRQLRRRLQRHQ